MLNVMSLDRSDLRLNSDMRDFTQELSRVMNNVDQSPLNCPECFKSLEDEDLLSHLSGSQKSSERCEDCEMSFSVHFLDSLGSDDYQTSSEQTPSLLDTTFTFTVSVLF